MTKPIAERGYPHPELLAETNWLASRLSDPKIRVVDLDGLQLEVEPVIEETL